MPRSPFSKDRCIPRKLRTTDFSATIFNIFEKRERTSAVLYTAHAIYHPAGGAHPPPKLRVTNLRVSFEAGCKIRRGPGRDDDISPMAYPEGHLPSFDRSPYAASDHPAKGMGPQRCHARMLPFTSPIVGSFGLEDEVYFKTVAGCRTCTFFIGSLIPRVSLP